MEYEPPLILGVVETHALAVDVFAGSSQSVNVSAVDLSQALELSTADIDGDVGGLRQ